MNDPFVTIDLHGLMRDVAMRRIDRTLRDAGSASIRFVWSTAITEEPLCAA